MAAARKTIATSRQFNYFHNSSFIPSTVDKCHQWTGSFLLLQVSILLIFSVESLELMAAQFLWKLYVAFPHEFTLSTKTNLLRVIFFTDTKKLRHPGNDIPTNKQNMHNPRKVPQNFKWFHNSLSIYTHSKENHFVNSSHLQSLLLTFWSFWSTE